MTNILILAPLIVLLLIPVVAMFLLPSIARKRVGRLRRLNAYLQDYSIRVDDERWPTLELTRVRGTLYDYQVEVGFEQRGGHKTRKTYTQVSVGVLLPPGSVQLEGPKNTGQGGLMGMVFDMAHRVDLANMVGDRDPSTFSQAEAVCGLIDSLFATSAWRVELRADRDEPDVFVEKEFSGSVESNLEPATLMQIIRPLQKLAQLTSRKLQTIPGLGGEERPVFGDPQGKPCCPACGGGVDLEDSKLAACSTCGTVHHGKCLDGVDCAAFGCGIPVRAGDEASA